MRFVSVAVICLCLSVPVTAQAQEQASEGGMDCAAQAALVMEAVNARLEGDPKRKTRRMLRAALDRNAGDMLSDWIYDLPEAQLTDAVGVQWQAQCEAL